MSTTAPLDHHRISSIDLSGMLTEIRSNHQFHEFGNSLREKLENRIKDQMQDPVDRVICLTTEISFFWPYHSFGAINTNAHINVDTLTGFLWYLENRSRYKAAFDLGANVGLHSVLMAKAGMRNISAFEPDPAHIALLENALGQNDVANVVSIKQCAVAGQAGHQTFVRVENNRTANHLKGLKQPYGPLTEFEVETITMESVGVQPDFIKMDVEGAELEIIPTIPEGWWEKLEAWIEVHGQLAAESLFDYANERKVNIFLQRTGWKRIKNRDEMPIHYNDGAIFMSRRPQMGWLSESVAE